MSDTTISVTILKRDLSITAAIVVTFPRFDILSKLEAWFTGHTLHTKTKEHRYDNGTALYKLYRTEFHDNVQAENFITFAEQLCSAYIIDASYDEDVTVVKTPHNTWFALGKIAIEAGVLDLGTSSNHGSQT